MTPSEENNKFTLPNTDSVGQSKSSSFSPVPEHESTTNPLDLFRDRLSGRWILAISVALVVAILAAVVAYIVAPVYYQATGHLRGTSRHEIIIKEISETGGADRAFDSFLSGAVELLKSRQVLQHAVESSDLEGIRNTRGYYPLLEQISDRLVAYIPRDTMLIRVQYRDSDADSSALITNAVMKAYIDRHGMDSEDSISTKLGHIRQYKKENRSKAESKRVQQQALIRNSQYGTANLDPLITRNVEEMEALRNAEKQLALIITNLEEEAKAQGREITGKEIPNPTTAQLDTFEPSLKALRADLEQEVIRLGQLRGEITPEHRHYRSQESKIAAIKENLARRVIETTNDWREGPGQEQSFERLIEQKARFTDQLIQKRDEITEMNTLRERYLGLQREITELDSQYSMQDERLSSLQFEEPALKDKVEIVEFAVSPKSTNSDKSIQIAAGVFAGSILLVFGVFFLLGSIDQRAFAIRQLQTDKGLFQCLGVVPNTSPNSSDPDAVDVGMTCVHRLRNRIESIRLQTDRGFVLLVSSPFQGDGKTTLATLLGWSYAEAGYKTCMVDCDFIGRSLSHQFEKLQEPGMKEAIKAGEIGKLAINLNGSNLNILPIGIDESVNPEHMPLTAIDPILNELRDKFDIIIVDTGPLNGAVESIPIAGSVDGVVLTLRKGRSRLPLRRCVQDLRDLGAPYLGVVLNYADRADYRNFSSKSKSIDELLRDEETGKRTKNPLTDRISKDPPSSAP